MPTLDIALPDALQQALVAPTCLDLSLPKPSLPRLTLPTGGSIQAIADLTKGIPSDCSMNASLMLQIAPIMASMECLLEVLKFISAMIDALKSVGTNPTAVPSAIFKIIEAADGLAPCFAMPLGLTIPAFIEDLLQLIVKLLKCSLQQLKSIVTLLEGLQLDISSAAQNGNDALAAQLQCAQENGINAAQGAMRAIDPIATLLKLAEPFFSLMPGAPTIQMPALASGGSIDEFKSVIDTLDQLVLTIDGILQALP